MSIRATAISLIILLLLGIPGFIFIKNAVSRTDFGIYYKNSHDVSIYDPYETEGDGNRKLVTTATRSGEVKRLLKNHPYIVTYTGNDGYANGEIKVNTTSSSQVKINPYYSKDRLKPMAAAVFPQVNKVFSSVYATVSDYQLNKGQLYHWGDWYGTTLAYTGNDTFNDDVLRVVFHKENDIWTLKTRPPDITLSKFIYKDVPFDVLSAVNKL